MTDQDDMARYRAKNHNKLNEWQKEYHQGHRGERNRYAKDYRKRNKLTVVTHYSGGVCKCARCGFNDIRALQIDHIGGGGERHRRSITQDFYMWLIKNDFPSGFQVLCANCQIIKSRENNECARCGRKPKEGK